MTRMNGWTAFAVIAAIFLIAYFVPAGWLPFGGPALEAFALLQWYAREHVLLCLVPAFFIAGAISVFISQQSVIRYLGPEANRMLSYGVASVSGGLLAVCSCTVLPLFAGIYKRGAGLGPAVTFLYSGPAINILAIILTTGILGWRLGLARALGAILFSIIIGLLMQLVFKKSKWSQNSGESLPPPDSTERPLAKNALYFLVMLGLLVIANWGKPGDDTRELWSIIYRMKWWFSGLLMITLAVMLIRWFSRKEIKTWGVASWGFARQILPLLFLGVLAAGFLLGRPGHEGVIPPEWISGLVGGNSWLANLFASIVGAFMYFATLTEVPILEGLLGAGMGQGPALALLLAGPALSLPNMLVIHSILGSARTLVFIALVIVMSSLAGLMYGALVVGGI